MTKALAAFMLLALLAFIVFASAGAGPPAAPSSADADSMQALLAQMLRGMGDFFSAVARMSTRMEYDLVQGAPGGMQAMLGMLICLRTVLVLIGLAALSLLRRASRRMLG